MTHIISVAHDFEPRVRRRGDTRVAFFGLSALLFAASAAVTVVWCTSMPAMDGMSMAWIRMPGQMWPGAAASFIGMWIVMMAAMMLPSLTPTLWRYREAAGRTGAAALAGVGYFFVWAVFGMAIYPVGVALAAAEMRHQALAGAVPMASGVVVLMAGALQLTAWKAHHLACCRDAAARVRSLDGLGFGLRLGLHCCFGCAGMTAILLAIGIMDWRAMTVVTAAITAERVAPDGERVARAIGAAAIGAGLILIARAAGLG